MNLHRVNKVPDWEKVHPSRRKRLQKIAAATGGIATLGNVLTIAGATCVASGLIDVHQGRTRRGTWKIGIGRVIDIFDGIVADKTQTKSPLGEALDATVDKVAMAGIVFVFAKKNIISKRTAWHIATQNLANVAVTGAARALDIDIHPSAAGKQTMLLQGMTLGFNGLATAAEEDSDTFKANQLRLIANLCEIGAAGKGAKATAGYVRDLAEGSRLLLAVPE